MATRILLVEDDPIIVEALTELLVGEGYAVDHAARQDEAIELALGGANAPEGHASPASRAVAAIGAAASPYSLVLLDVTLAQGNGFAVCTALKQALPQLPVIFGFRSQMIEPGQKLDELAPALEVIMQAALNFPDIRIMVVDMRNPGKTVISMRFRDQKVCRVLIPAKDRDVNMLLTALQSAILKAERSGNTRGIFDLSFDRNVIIR